MGEEHTTAAAVAEEERGTVEEHMASKQTNRPASKQAQLPLFFCTTAEVRTNAGVIEAGALLEANRLLTPFWQTDSS